MRSILYLTIFLFFSLFSFAQSTKPIADYNGNNNSLPIRNITDNGLNGIEVSYHFQNPSVSSILNKKISYSRLFTQGFSHLQEVGLPALPSHIDLVVVPEGATYDLKIFDEMPEVISTNKIYPALQPARDTEGAPEPKFEINEDFYNTDQLYPSQSVKIIGTMVFRGVKFLKVQTCPVQYNASKGKLYFHKNINYKINFSNANRFIKDYNNHTENYLKKILNYPLNSKNWKKEAEQFYSNNTITSIGNSKNYIIITHSNYQAAADSIANWKRQLGYSVEVVSSNNWTSSTVKTAVQSRYASWTPKPDYLLIIGDHQDVPAEMHINSSNDQFGTDLYYVCMDGNSDYVPDMAKGRISANSAANALMQVQKIINYERNPITDSSFYQNALNCAQYQDDDVDGFADRRFLQTSENIRDYFISQGYYSQRIYYCDQLVTPTRYNNGYYSNGQMLDSALWKSNGFSWNGGSTEIKNAINAGKFLVFHRDHGYAGGYGWAHPYFVNTKINGLNNGNKLPVVFSINCHTGEFTLNQCFAETFMRKQNAGAVGVIAASYYSYSGYNDGLSIGMIDGIWSNPGLLPQFGNGGNNNPNVTAHTDIVRMGDVVDHGLVRMVQTWGGNNSGNRYTNELFHYFGDPAMRIWTENPGDITAIFADTISCSDTSIAVNNCSDSNAVVTIMGNGKLLGKTTLLSGSGVVALNSIQGSYLTITISARNKKPLIKIIYLGGNGSLSLFNSSISNKCKNDSLGSLEIFPACGTPPYSILWSTGDTTRKVDSLAGGIYTVTVTDANNITINDTLSVFSPSTILNNNSIITNAKCYFQASGSIIVNITGGVGAYTYLWNNGSNNNSLSNISAGNYSVTITDSMGCELSNTFTITEPSPLDISMSTTDDITNDCSGIAVCTPSGGTLPYTYQWNDAANQTTATASNLCKGMYKVILKDSNNCTTYRSIFISNTVGISNAKENSNINIYPNPIKDGVFYVEFTDNKAETIILKLYNSIGELVDERSIVNSTNGREIYKISSLASGIYYLHIQGNDSTENTFKIMIE